MAETASGEFDKKQELLRQFKDLDDDSVANSVVTGELFMSGPAGEDEVKQRIDEIKIGAVQDSAKFRVAKMYYEDKDDINAALRTAEQINNADEQTRCLVQLALAVLENENDYTLAENIVARSTQDTQGYLKYYEEEKQNVLERNKNSYVVYTD